ncbi:hypothetical protein SeMB42_g07843 [Synchytrium endobioticum]|uniref:Uncharacterized protein n=1 Tax=Synchytrium endobioticum TaxID=286115 RepID=A0A507BN70_9FUNG|nr:hypothetical protein SeMB42_g07843 [Synchytrium endobioticum]
MGFMIETIKIMGMYYMRWYNLKKDSCDVECGEQSLPIACIGTLTSLFSGCLPGPIVWLIRWLSIPWSVIVAFYVIKFAWWLVLYVVPWTRPRAIRKVTDYVDARMPKNATIRTQWDGIKRRYLARRRDGAPDLRDEIQTTNAIHADRPVRDPSRHPAAFSDHVVQADRHRHGAQDMAETPTPCTCILPAAFHRQRDVRARQ